MWRWNKPEKMEATPPEPAPEVKAAPPVHALADALPDPALILARNGWVLHANPGAAELLEQNPQGQHVSATIRAPVILDAVSRVLEGDGPLKVEFERRVPLPQHYEAWIAPILGHPDGPAILISLKDLTREQMIERMRADFVANASHELRTPLTALLGFIETLQGPARKDESARDRFLDLMRVQGARMKRLIDDLLSLSRIEMNAHQRPENLVDLQSLARHVADIMGPLAKEQGVEISLDLTVGLQVHGDWDELTQVVQNLVENALKYANSGKKIDISTALSAQSVELAVRDYGQGIAAEHLPRLTERFYRVSVQESRSRGGTGLGLAIVKHILNRHRARLLIASTPGEGSRFTIRFPAVEN
jgi:two-component system, OmpR family, phosphate regulon sensor histidine kinase PhoR